MATGLRYVALVATLAVGCAPAACQTGSGTPAVDPGDAEVPPTELADSVDLLSSSGRTTAAAADCAQLRKHHCREATPEAGTCEAFITQILTERLTPWDAKCVAGARTRRAIRACPAIECP